MIKCLLLFVEGDTEVEFYKQVVANARKLHPVGRFDTNIEYRNVRGVGGFKNIALRKFIKEIKPKYGDNCEYKVEVPAYGIELELIENEKNQKFVIAELTKDIRENYLKEVINLFLEIYGSCYVFAETIRIDDYVKRQRCNWEMLPPGQMPSKHLKQQLRQNGEKTDTYNVYRLEYMEKYRPEKVVEGINGFKGYYAYILGKCCVLESAVYGNATYVIPKDNWEILSQKTKKELLDEDKVLAKIEHTANWEENVRNKFGKLGMSH